MSGTIDITPQQMEWLKKSLTPRAERRRRIIVVDDEPVTGPTIPKGESIPVKERNAPPKHFHHRYPDGSLVKSGTGAQYKVDDVTGAFHRLNPVFSKKARRKQAQRERKGRE